MVVYNFECIFCHFEHLFCHFEHLFCHFERMWEIHQLCFSPFAKGECWKQGDFYSKFSKSPSLSTTLFKKRGKWVDKTTNRKHRNNFSFFQKNDTKLAITKKIFKFNLLINLYEWNSVVFKPETILRNSRKYTLMCGNWNA